MRTPVQTLVVFVISLAACGPASLQLPAGVTCTKTSFPSFGGSELSDALSRAGSGDCVVAAAGSYSAALSVPAGVNLTVESGRRVQLSSTVTLAAGATLSAVEITSASGIGVFINHHAQLTNVKVDRSSGPGIVAWCEDDCRPDPQISILTDVEVTHSEVGLWARGTKVKVERSRFADCQGQSLGSGYGVVASNGATLEMNGTVIEGNREVGMLVDGALDTSATLTTVTVKNNLGRGIWAQGLTGTMLVPRLSLDTCTLDGNAIAGIGARMSTGIRMQGGRVSNTRLSPAQTTMPGVTVMVGDGVGVFEGTGQVAFSGVTLDSNARTQVLVDTGAIGLSVQGGTITAQTGQLGVVVQRTTATVDAPNIITPAAGMELPISAPSLALPVR